MVKARFFPGVTSARYSINGMVVGVLTLSLVACVNIEVEPEPEPEPVSVAPVIEKVVPVETQLIAAFSSQQLTTEVTDRGVVVYIPGVFFTFDNADLSFEAREKIRFFASVVQRDFVVHRQVAVEGHTDSTGDEEFNFGLSKRRAEAAMDELVFSGIDPDRIELGWFGESAPIAPNESLEGRGRNRRVEFIILNPSE